MPADVLRTHARSPRVAPLLLLLGGVLPSACNPPATVRGSPSVAPSPDQPWENAAQAGGAFSLDEDRRASRGLVAHEADSAVLRQLTLPTAVDLALRNNPETRLSWAQARAAAAVYGSTHGSWWPQIDANVSASKLRSVSQNPARIPADRETLTPTLSLSYLLYDFGGRTGATEAARQALYAADLNHNATVQNVVLEAAFGYFLYQGSRGLFVAAGLAVETARTNLTAAERRHDVGLATIADVLQARTALSQAELTAQSADGNVQVARAALAQALGVPANGGAW